MSTPSWRWGILAAGHIARKFAKGLSWIPNAEIKAVGARSLDRAQSFANELAIPKAYGSYEALAADPEIDIIYIASPHPWHEVHTLLCLDHGKHVLCEKPLALNAIQAQRMMERASEKGLFLMEAMWTRFLPAIIQVQNWIQAGHIGQVQMIQANFNYYAAFDPESRKFNPQLAGGALLDLGVYPLNLAYMVMHEAPVKAYSSAKSGPSGTDDHSAYFLQYASGAVAMLSAGFSAEGPREARILGDAGSIHLPMFWRADRVVIQANHQPPEVHAFPYAASGLQLQAAHVMECLQKGQLQSSRMSHAESLRILRLMDQFRAEWGLVYPGE